MHMTGRVESRDGHFTSIGDCHFTNRHGRDTRSGSFCSPDAAQGVFLVTIRVNLGIFVFLYFFSWDYLTNRNLLRSTLG